MKYRDDILELVDDKWITVSTMRNRRSQHAVAIVNVDDYDYLKVCN